MERCDVVVVGARLAGACAAAHLARAGRSVVVLDRSRFPSDQLSTHVLFPHGVDELRRMGALDGILALGPARSPWLRLQTEQGMELVERWRPVNGIDYCLCIPRPEQDLELVRAARAAGADVRERSEVLGVLWRGGRAAGVRYRDADGEEHELQATLVVGADGRRSLTAAQVGAHRPYRASRNGRGLVFRYLDDPRAGEIEGRSIMQWRDGDSLAFAFPSCPRGRVVVLFMGAAREVAEARRDPDGYWERKLALHPGMRERIRGAGNLGKLRSTADTTAYFRASTGPGWALAGDAGHFKDPVTGQGQRDALWSGRTIAETAAAHLDDPGQLDLALRRWEQERDRECVHAYHFANLETHVRPVPPALIETLRRISRDTRPDAGDAFARTRTTTEVLTLPRLARGLAVALRRAGGNRGPMLRDAVTDLRTHVGLRAELRADRFRCTRRLVGSEHPDPDPPAPPAPKAAPAVQVAPAREAVAA